jgi:hypothetical protein
MMSRPRAVENGDRMDADDSAETDESIKGLFPVVLTVTTLTIVIGIGVAVGYADPGGYVVLAALYHPRVATVLISVMIAVGVIVAAGRGHRSRQIVTTVVPLTVLAAICLLGQVCSGVGRAEPSPRTIATSPDGSLSVRVRTVFVLFAGEEIRVTIRSNAGLLSRERCIYQSSGEDVSARFLGPDRVELTFSGHYEEFELDRDHVRPVSVDSC